MLNLRILHAMASELPNPQELPFVRQTSVGASNSVHQTATQNRLNTANTYPGSLQDHCYVPEQRPGIPMVSHGFISMPIIRLFRGTPDVQAYAKG